VNFATDLRVGDLGSSRVNPDPNSSVGPYAGIQAAAQAHGVQVLDPVDVGTDAGTLSEAVTAASSADFVVFIAGLTPQDEGEEYTGAGDRIGPDGGVDYHLDCKSGSGAQDALISQIAAMGKPMVVVLEGGSAIDMPWLDSVPAVVMAWYPGEKGGTALGKLLFGDVNFSGKLPITWPRSELDEPPFNTGGGSVNGMMGGVTTMGYYLGYRWFDCSGSGSSDCPAQKITPLFAYGSGLSYTTFRYDFLGVPCSTVSQHGVVDVQVAITNTGTVPGNEVAFLFVSYPQTTARRSVKELKGWHRTKQPIEPGQTVEFTIPLRIQDLKYWNSSASQWTVESGPVQIMVGPSADNLPLTDTLTVTSTQ
jgi:beta-glucosidase